MSRLQRAIRELTRSDAEAVDRVYPDDWRIFSELNGPLTDIAGSLKRMERRKRRPRIVMCEHPELHPELEVR
jgi:hypothetical protein